MAEFDFNSLSAQEQEELRRQYLMNQAQKQLMSPGFQPDMSQYEFKKPENIGQAFGNVLKNQVLNPVQERLGMREPLSSVVKKMQIRDMQQDQAREFLNAANRQQLQNFFINQGQDAGIIKNLGLDELRSIATSQMSDPQTDPFGVTTQRNVLTGEQSVINAPPPELQEFLYEQDRRKNRNDQTPSPYRMPYPNVGNFTPGMYKDELEGLKSDRDITKNRAQKLDDRAITRIDGITTPIYQGMADIGGQRANLNQLSALIDAGAQTGFAQGFLAQARNLGIDLGLNVEDPSPELVFGAISNLIALPLVKSLGSNPTDTDLDLILNSAPSLSLTPEGNRILIDTIKLKLDRKEIIAQALMAFEDSNQDLLRSNPVGYRQKLDRLLIEVQNSEEFQKKSVFQLKAQAASLLGKEPDPAKITKGL
jgi:hypothetical protein